jgi:hypothetical protein
LSGGLEASKIALYVNVRGEMNILWHNFKKMPFLLKFFTFHASVFLIALPLSFVPIAEPEMYGKKISFVEFWQSGMALIFVYLGIFFPASAYLMLRRHRYGRIAYLSSFGIFIMICSIFEYIHEGGTSSLFPLLIPYIFLVLYFYCRKPAKEYFIENL